MSALDEKQAVALTEKHRKALQMELRSLVNLASEPISHYYPMKTFIHHNPLHGLEHLPFEKAIAEGERLFGGKGYLTDDQYRSYYRQGQVSDEAIDRAVEAVATDATVRIGDRDLSQKDVLRTLLVEGTGEVIPDVATSVLRPALGQAGVRALAEKIEARAGGKGGSRSLSDAAKRDRDALAKNMTLAEWCDRALGTNVQDQVNHEIIKWCAAFLDEGHAPYEMPSRKKTFWAGWKELARDDASGSILGISDWAGKINRLPTLPEEAIHESLTQLAIPKALWIDYFTLHLAQLSGWAGHIKWRSEQLDYEWQLAYPVDLIKYTAVRLFYERELVAIACRDKLGVSGSYEAILSCLNDHPTGYGLYQEYRTQGLPDELTETLDLSRFTCEPVDLPALDKCDAGWVAQWERLRNRQDSARQALMVLHLVRSMDVAVEDLAKSGDDALDTLIDWIEGFPESRHGPVWLNAFESTYLKSLVKRISVNLPKLAPGDDSEDDAQEKARPLAQAIFCIDVRSECFRRHLEETGGNETFGFAGFFGVPICYEEFASEQQTDQCPVLLKPKHVVREIPRLYQVKEAEKFVEGQKLAKAGHTLLHDLKENVITPYIMVEAIGWFFGFKLFGQTLSPKWFHNGISWFKDKFTVPLGTVLTVDKIQNEEAEEMIAARHRASIYNLLVQQYGRRGAALPHDQVERLRKLALGQMEPDHQGNQDLYRLLQCSQNEVIRLVETLRKEFKVHARDAARRMHKITQTGFTVIEQAHFVETALRILGFTKSFARLVLLCGHASTSDNNPYESALDCGACGGNHGISNARVLAEMANKQEVRSLLADRGLHIPPDTHFLPGQHDTTTDEVKLYDLEDVPVTHRRDLMRLQQNLKQACERNSRERMARFPDAPALAMSDPAAPETRVRSMDWSQVRPEWGLSGHTAFIVGRRALTQGINLEGRTFLHSYDYAQDPTGKYLEIIMTAPMIVGQWINMEHYFSTVDPTVYGSGSKVYHNVTGRLGVMYGSESDLCPGLPVQTVLNGDEPYHEPMRIFAVYEAPRERLMTIVKRHDILQRLIKNEWVHVVALEPETQEFYLCQASGEWQRIQ